MCRRGKYNKRRKDEKVKRKVYNPSCEKLTYKGDNLTEPIKTEEEEVVNNAIGLNSNKLPCWIIKNNPSINNRHGQSDLEDIKDQNYAYKIIKENLCVPLKIAFNKEEFLMIGGYGSRFRGRKSFRY